MNHMDDVGCALTVCIYFATIPGDLRCNECIMTAKNESIILFCLFFLLRSTLAPEHGNNPVYFQCSVWHFERVTDLSANRSLSIHLSLFRLGIFNSRNHKHSHAWRASGALRACGAVSAQSKDTFDLWRFFVTTSNQRKCFGNAIPDLHYCLVLCHTRAWEIESGPGAKFDGINVMHDNKCVNTK